MKSISRRTFVKKSTMASTSLLLAPLVISCHKDKIVSHTVTNLNGFLESDFAYGVASFDPTQTSVIIWTRFQGETNTSKLLWQIALDINFNDVIREGEVTATDTTDFTVAIKIEGLDENKKLYYRFAETSKKVKSVIGETQTLPANASEIQLAVCSCSNYAAGLFNVYKEIASSNAQIVVNLGDYIYEGNSGGFGTNAYTKLLDRQHSPSKELITLEDYRTRYKQYRTDKNLQLLHQKKPFVLVWDDHEIANDAHQNGAQNHDASEGDYQIRKQNGIRAFSEYLPMNVSETHKIYRNFEMGGLVNLVMLDTRHIGRNKQLSYDNYFDGQGFFNSQDFEADLTDTSRTMLGVEQRNWLFATVNKSNAVWQVLGQQVLMGKMLFPIELLQTLRSLQVELSRSGTISETAMQVFGQQLTELVTLKKRLLANDATLTTQEKLRIETVVPYNLDAWDGYPAERELLYIVLANKNVVCLAGDTHNHWYNDLSTIHKVPFGVELATASVTSPGIEAILNNNQQVIGNVEEGFPTLIEDLHFVNATHKGYLSLTFTTQSIQANWIGVDTIHAETYTAFTIHSETILS